MTTQTTSMRRKDLRERVAEAADVQGVGFYIETGGDEPDRCSVCGQVNDPEMEPPFVPDPAGGCVFGEDPLDAELDRVVDARRAAERGSRIAADKSLQRRMRGRK